MNEAKHSLADSLVIIFEGIDGTGKTTQAKLVEQKLAQTGKLVSIRRSPGGTPIGEALRLVLLGPTPRPPMTDLYIALAMQESLATAIDAARDSGSVVLLDRSPLSIAAYQIYGSGIDESLGWKYVDQHMKRLQPALTIIYDCPPAAALERARQTSGSSTRDYFESMPLSYFDQVAKGYKLAAERYPAVVIDATQSIEAVHAQTMQHITQLLP